MLLFLTLQVLWLMVKGGKLFMKACIKNFFKRLWKILLRLFCLLECDHCDDETEESE